MISNGVAAFLLWILIFEVRHGQSGPLPQVLPGQIPPHLATHPALSSVTQGRESALMQYAYNIQNRRGPSPSPLVLQNNQERNLQLVNQLSQQRSGQPFVPSGVGGQGHNHGHSGHNHGNEDPQRRAFEEIQKYKGQGSASNAYNPTALTPTNQNPLNYPHQHGVGVGPSAIPPSDDNEGEDIKKLKSILALSGRPVQGSSNYGTAGIPPGARSPQIGVAGERGVLNPAQFGQPSQHNHDHHAHAHQHHHPTPFPATAQSQNSLGNLQYGQGPRPSVYSGQGPSSPSPSVVHVPYGSDGHAHTHHGHDPHHHGQGRYLSYDSQNHIYNPYTHSVPYPPSNPSDHHHNHQQYRPINEFDRYVPSNPNRGSSDSYPRYRLNEIHQNQYGPNEFHRFRPSNYPREQHYRK